MQDHTLPRTGDSPLRFTGELLAQGSSRQLGTYLQNRFHECSIYRTAAHKYVVAIRYRTDWRGENQHACANVADHPAEVAGILQGYLPLAYVHGYPPQYSHKQRLLEQVITAGYQGMVSMLLSGLGEEFAERVA